MPPSRVQQQDGDVEEIRWDKKGKFGPARKHEIERWAAELAAIVLFATYWPPTATKHAWHWAGFWRVLAGLLKKTSLS